MRRIIALSCLAVVTAVGAAGCRSDGRTLRPARPDQNATVSTTSIASSTSVGAIVGGEGAFQTTTSVAIPRPTVPGGPTVSAPWRDGSTIDARYGCDGEDVAPALLWSAAPAGTVELAVTLTDDDHPDIVHWIIAGLPSSLTALSEGQVPAGAFQAANDFGTVGYAGPCNEPGSVDTYRIRVHYLSQQIELGDGAAGKDMQLAIDSATLAVAEVTGLYSRG